MCIICLCSCSRDEKPKMSPLRKAVSTGNSFRVKNLITQGANVLEIDPQTHQTLLMHSKAVQNPEILRMLLETDSSNINIQTNKGWTALVYAIIFSAPPESIELLLRYGANPNDVMDQKGTSVLHFAAYQGNEKVINVLLNASADINIQDNDMVTPLMLAAGFKNKKAVQLLLSRGADINLSDPEGRTVLMRSPDIIFPLINLSSVELNKTDNKGYSLLHWAAMQNNTHLIHTLIQAGLNPNINNTSGKTPLMSAAQNANNEAIEDLLKLGADINQQDSIGFTALHYSVLGYKDSPETIKLLLKNHANINHTSNDGVTALMLAAFYGLAESVKLLLQNGADPNLQDSSLGTVLTHAESSKQYEIIQLLLQSGNKSKDLSIDLLHSIIDASQNKHRYSGAMLENDIRGGITGNIMFVPIMENDLENVNKLISEGGDVNLSIRNGITPLMFAAIHDCPSIISALLKAGANINAQSEEGDTALILAATLGKKENVNELLKFHANIHVRNKEGETALFRASSLIWQLVIRGEEKWQPEDMQAHIDIVNSLILAGAEVEIYDKSNESPLLFASRLVGHHKMVALLLEAGADPNHRNNEGKNSWDYALELKEKYDDPRTLEILINHNKF